MTSPAGRVESEALVLERTFAASPERVFAAWTDPRALRQWWGPPGSTLGEVDMDLRVGGRYRFAIHYPDREILFVSGVYEIIEPPYRLVFSWRWENSHMDIGPSRVTLEIQGDGHQTRLRLTHAKLPSAEARRNHREGWEAILAGLAAFLAPARST